MHQAAMGARSVAVSQFSRILHPTDFSEGGQGAFHSALKLALACRARLDIVHVERSRERAGLEWHAFPRVRETLGAWGLLDRNAPSSAVADQLGVQVVKTDIAASNAPRALAGHTIAKLAELVVVGAHCREGLSGLFHPQVSEPLARIVRVPALFIPEGHSGFVDPATGAPTLRNILVPVDREPAPDQAIELARMIGELVGVAPQICLLHVGQEIDAVGGAYAGVPGVRRVCREGPVVDTIVAVAKEIEADLIVMATCGHDGVLDVFRGSTTEQVLHRAGRPVLASPAARG